MLYQAYGCKERTKHRDINQTTRRQVKNLINVLITKETKRSNNCVREYENVCEIEW